MSDLRPPAFESCETCDGTGEEQRHGSPEVVQCGTCDGIGAVRCAGGAR